MPIHILNKAIGNSGEINDKEFQISNYRGFDT